MLHQKKMKIFSKKWGEVLQPAIYDTLQKYFVEIHKRHLLKPVFPTGHIFFHVNAFRNHMISINHV